ncbi:MAG: hypothetical protein WCE68_12290 [Anaerolineales bacterium]
MSNKPVPVSVEDVKLSSSTTVRRYKELEAARDQKEIADFVRQRFRERYLDPALAACPESGFTLMAINCLMIETLVSFWHGWPNTRDKSEAAFCFFFDREEEFSSFHGHAKDFYVHVRCGILHQAETTGGWLIHLRKEQLFDADHKIIDALEFTNRMETCLKNYKHELEAASWEDEIWVNFRKKMKAIISNCEAE